MWCWVPYQEDDRIGKDRPIVIIGRATQAPGHCVGLKLSTKDHSGDPGWVLLGSGAWDRSDRQSWVQTDFPLAVPPHGIRREGTALDIDRFRWLLQKVGAEQSGHNVD